MKAARAELNSDVNDALDLINHISNESDKCVVLPLIQEDIIVATKMAIKGNKPSKSKAEWGLVGSVEKVGVEPHPKRVGPAS